MTEKLRAKICFFGFGFGRGLARLFRVCFCRLSLLDGGLLFGERGGAGFLCFFSRYCSIGRGLLGILLEALCFGPCSFGLGAGFVGFLTAFRLRLSVGASFPLTFLCGMFFCGGFCLCFFLRFGLDRDHTSFFSGLGSIARSGLNEFAITLLAIGILRSL